MLALITPVITSTEGRWVASTRWMPTARAIWAMRQTDSSTSRAATIIRSLSSSTTIRMNGSRSGAGLAGRRPPVPGPRVLSPRWLAPRCWAVGGPRGVGGSRRLRQAPDGRRCRWAPRRPRLPPVAGSRSVRGRHRSELASVEGVVVAGDVAHPVLGQQVVAALHLLDGPARARWRPSWGRPPPASADGAGRCTARARPAWGPPGCRRTWSGVARISTEVRMRVDARRLAGPGGPGDEDVGHLGQVRHHRPAGDVAPERHLEGMVGVARPRGEARMSPSATSWRRRFGTSTPIADLPGDRRQDPHVGRGHGVGDVLATATVTRATFTPGPARARSGSPRVPPSGRPVGSPPRGRPGRAPAPPRRRRRPADRGAAPWTA